MTASRKISKSQTAMSVQEKRALDRAFKKMENTEGKFYPFTRAEADAYNAYDERNKKANAAPGLDSLVGKQYIGKVNITSEEEEFASAQIKVASARQVGGDHYKKMGIQTWDVVDTWPLDQRIGYYRGNALKYVMRMGSKDIQEVEISKGQHYLEKLLEVLKEFNDAQR